MSDYQHLSAPGNRICTRGTLFRSAAGHNNEKCTDNRLIISAFYLFLRGKSLVQSGAGGSRTPVQTRCKSAFYMFSLGLIVGNREVPDQPACRLSSKVSLPHRSLRSLACHFRYFGPDAGGRGFRGSTRNYGPCPCREIRGN